ncbi:hypothetical protein G9A89_022702 [Geosiphon pyriformis]|nr:hypothetical protein G9A89_022702 [Geosiphon pyriformis]
MSGNQIVTPEDYPRFGPSAVNNPPFCGMPYAELDLNRITAVQGMSQSDCGTCLKVCKSSNSSAFVNVLAVDMGGNGLDLSTGVFQILFGQENTPDSVKWFPVDTKYCDGVWRKGGQHPNQKTSSPPVKHSEKKLKKPKKHQKISIIQDKSKKNFLKTKTIVTIPKNNNHGKKNHPAIHKKHGRKKNRL